MKPKVEPKLLQNRYKNEAKILSYQFGIVLIYKVLFILKADTFFQNLAFK